jgi:hypothetical protein
MDLSRLLKISAPTVAEPWAAKEKRFLCPHCGGQAIASFPWNADDLQRARLSREAIEEHRKICPKAEATEARVYEISYPRV